MSGTLQIGRLLLFLSYFLRLILAAVFIYASYDKLVHPDVFAERIVDFRILPYSIVNFTAIFLPVLESIPSVFLLIGVWTRAIILLFSTLLFIFIGAMSSVIIRGIELYGCGCFVTAPTAEKLGWLSMWREGTLLACAVTLYILELKRSAVSK